MGEWFVLRELFWSPAIRKGARVSADYIYITLRKRVFVVHDVEVSERFASTAYDYLGRRQNIVWGVLAGSGC